MKSRSWLALAGGAVLFLVVQGVLMLTAAPIEGVEYSGWFLNSGRGVLAVAVVFAVAGVLVGAGRQHGLREAALIAAGALVALIAVLFSIGPGNLFPIVVVFGAVIVTVATAFGAGAGIAVRSWRHDPGI